LVVSGVIAARILGPADRGLFALLTASVLSIAGVVCLGVPVGLALQIAKHPGSSRDAILALKKPLIVQASVATVATFIVVVLVTRSYAIPEYVWASLAALAAVATIALRYSTGVLQGQHKFMVFNLARIAPAAAPALAILVLAVLALDAVTDFVIAWCGSMALIGGAFVAYTVRHSPERSGNEVDGAEMVRYGAKGFLGITPPLESLNVDQLVIGALAGPTALGFYVVGNSFTNLPRFFGESIGQVVFPRIGRARSSETSAENASGPSNQTWKLATDAIFLTAVTCLVACVALASIVGWLVPFFFGSSFDSSIQVAQVLLIASFFFSLRRILGDVLRAFDQPIHGSAAEVISWFVFAALVVPLARDHGAIGGAIAYSAAAVVSAVFIAGVTIRFRFRNQRSAR
jgi:O-antigen/teichoic acid export membrane protein